MENTNKLQFVGTVATTPDYSHSVKELEFYSFVLSMKRISNVSDNIVVIIKKEMAQTIKAGDRLSICGELRSHNNKSEIGNRLIIACFAHTVEDAENLSDENLIELSGVICKEPTYRLTPVGREICDLILAVNRKHKKTDYLPCIAWGKNARLLRDVEIGAGIAIEGRVQSREYKKVIDEVESYKTAYEISVSKFYFS